MSAPTTIALCIIFEDELRKAAALLVKAAEASDEDFSQRAVEALAACQVALEGVNDDRVLLLGNRAVFGRRKKPATVHGARQHSNAPAASDVAPTAHAATPSAKPEGRA